MTPLITLKRAHQNKVHDCRECCGVFLSFYSFEPVTYIPLAHATITNITQSTCEAWHSWSVHSFTTLLHLHIEIQYYNTIALCFLIFTSCKGLWLLLPTPFTLTKYYNPLAHNIFKIGPQLTSAPYFQSNQLATWISTVNSHILS